MGDEWGRPDTNSILPSWPGRLATTRPLSVFALCFSFFKIQKWIQGLVNLKEYMPATMNTRNGALHAVS